MAAPPRLVPDVPLPPYAFVPGQAPHPHSDPAGHRYGCDLPTPSADAWAMSQHFLLALDLFNHGYYWEAHELWEQLWHAAGRHGVVATFLKALIQLAVVGVKMREGRTDGAVTHARRAAELLRQVDAAISDGVMAGLSCRTLRERALAAAEGAARQEGSRAFLFDWFLEPSGDSGI